MPSGKELLEEQHRKEEEQKKLLAETSNNGTKPAEETAVTKLTNETARIKAELERNKAKQELDVQNAGFPSVDAYKQGVEELGKNMTAWVNTKALERSQLDKEIAESAQRKEQLGRVHAELVQREKNVTEREKLVGEREAALGKAQQIEFQRLEVFNSDLETVRRNYNFIRNRLVRIANDMTMKGVSYADFLIQNIGILDKLSGKDCANLDKTFAKFLPNLKIIINDCYDTMTLMMRGKKPLDTFEMVKAFRELSASEVWRLIKPPRWIED